MPGNNFLQFPFSYSFHNAIDGMWILTADTDDDEMSANTWTEAEIATFINVYVH